MKPRSDARATITLFPPGSGGRDGPILSPWFGCVIQTGDANFEVRLRIDSTFDLGTTRTVGLDFLYPGDALAVIGPGLSFKLWEGRTIGWGKVEQVERALS